MLQSPLLQAGLELLQMVLDRGLLLLREAFLFRIDKPELTETDLLLLLRCGLLGELAIGEALCGSTLPVMVEPLEGIVRLAFFVLPLVDRRHHFAPWVGHPSL